MLNFVFFVTNILLGFGLAMDAFSVSLADGLAEPCMRRTKRLGVAGTFALLQGLMPLLGWTCVHYVMEWFTGLYKLIPWISLALLGYIGGKMLFDGLSHHCEEGRPCCRKIAATTILMQGLATSIDALSVGFTVSEYNALQALVACLLIGVVTFFICMGGLWIGKKFGTHLAGRASILGGVILIFIGIEIFLTGIF